MVAKDIEKLRRDFLWERCSEKNDHLVKWSEVVKLKEEGSLGIRRLKERNTALLGKWFWRFSVENGSSWQFIIQNKYGMDENLWECNRSLHSSDSLI